MIRISKSFYEVKTGFGEKTNYRYGIRFVYTKRLCEQKMYDFWVYVPFNTSPTWISFPRENKGHWEEDQHYLIMCSLFSCPEDFGKDRREEEETRKKSPVFSALSAKWHCASKMVSAVPHCSGLCCCLRS